MDITVLKTNRTIRNYPARSLSEIMLNIFPEACSLESLKVPSEENWIPVDDLDATLFGDISYHDVINNDDIRNSNDGFVRVVFQLKHENKSPILFANKYAAVEFLDSKEDDNYDALIQIEGNLPDDCYAIHSNFFECLHRTKDYLKHIVIAMTPENKKWEDFYLESFDIAIQKYEKEIECGHRVDDNTYYKKNAERFKREWGDKEKRKKGMCVEFSNMTAFATAYKHEIDEMFESTNNQSVSREIISTCAALQKYRNDSAHNVENLFKKENKESLDSALGKMIEMVNRLKNKGLVEKLGKYRKDINDLYNENFVKKLKKLGIIKLIEE